MRIAWASDLHLNHANLSAWDRLIDRINDSAADALVITGDISEADDVVFQLARLAEAIDQGIYFVLGNHDFYGSSIAATRRNVAACARNVDSLRYLTDESPIEWSSGCFVTGDDGWGDATIGDYEGSPVRLSDFSEIKDFRRVDPVSWPRLMRRQGSESADRLQRKLAAIQDDARHILVVTHVPPFRQACWYEGHTTDDFWAPFFVCGQVGEVLRRFAIDHPAIELQVLCGHTHHGGTARIEGNLIVQTAPADYGNPTVCQSFEVA